MQHEPLDGPDGAAVVSERQGQPGMDATVPSVEEGPPHVRSGRAERLTYARYLRLNDILGSQHGLTEAHDELQFIITHQVLELWFKLLLFELRTLRGAMQAMNLVTANRLVRRMHEILKNLIASFPLLETMRPADFLEIRSELGSASGFQSRQFREIEFVSGVKDERYVRAHDGDPEGQAALRASMEEPTLWDAFVGLLRRKGYGVESDAEIIRALIAIAKGDRHPALETLVEGLLEYDLLFAAWRSRHLLMVERMIGSKPGTGQKAVVEVVGNGYASMGSGAEYLKSTLAKRFFPLIWQARTFIEK